MDRNYMTSTKNRTTKKFSTQICEDSPLELVEKASNRITIMPGGGLRSSNFIELNQFVKAEFYHSSAIIDGNGVADFSEIQALKSKLNG